MKNRICELLREAVFEIRVVDGFDQSQYFKEPEQAVLTVSAEQIECRRIGFGNYLGASTFISEGEWLEEHGEIAEVTFCFRLWIPVFDKTDGSEIFLRICEKLLESEDYEFNGFSCGELKFLERNQCFLLEMRVKTEGILTRSQKSQMVSQVKLCAEYQ